MKQALIYSLKVWLTSVVAAPFLVLLIGLLARMADRVGIVLAMFILGMLFSLPSFLLLSLSCRTLKSMQNKVVIIKAELTVIGVLLTYIPFFIINDYAFLLNRDESSKYFFVLYSLLIIFGIWYYKLNGGSVEPVNLPDNNLTP